MLAKPVDGKMSVLLADEMPPIQDRSLADSFKSDGGFRQDDEMPLWAGLTQNYPIVEVEEEEDPAFGELGNKILNHKSNFQPVVRNVIEN